MKTEIPGLIKITEEELPGGCARFHFDVEDNKVDEFFSTFGLEPNDIEGFQSVVTESIKFMLDKHERGNNSLSNLVSHPSHYRSDSGFEAIDVIEAWDLGFNLGNALKYISRAGLKDKNRVIEDLEKAKWYLKREIKRIRNAK